MYYDGTTSNDVCISILSDLGPASTVVDTVTPKPTLTDYTETPLSALSNDIFARFESYYKHIMFHVQVQVDGIVYLQVNHLAYLEKH